MSTAVSIGISRGPDSFEAGREACIKAKLILKRGFADLAIVFSSIEYANSKLLEGIRFVLPGIKIIGCSGAGIFSPQGAERKAVAVMLIASDEIKFFTSKVESVKRNTPHKSGVILASDLLLQVKNLTRNIVIIFADAKIPNCTEALNGIKERLGMSFPILGCLASDNFCFSHTYMYFNDSVLTDTIAGVLLSGKNIHFGTGISHGWKPLGRPREITKAEGNIIKQIEGKPAICLYEEYFDKVREELQNTPLTQIAILYPLGLYLEAEKEYILRNVLEVSKDGSLICQADVPNKSQIRLMMGTKESALNATLKSLWQAKDAIRNRQTEFALIFNSLSRFKLLGRSTKDEVELTKKVLGDVPFLGVYSYAEISPLHALDYRGESYLHNESMSVITFASS